MKEKSKDDTKYIFSTGELFKQDDSITFRKNDKNNYIPVISTKEIYCFNDCTITTKLLDMFGKAGIVVHFFDYYGHYSGTFIPKEMYISGDLTIKQSEKFLSDRLIIAKSIVKGIALNIRFVLYHYYRHDKKELKPLIDYLNKDVERLLNKSDKIEQILTIEGNIWQRFYNSFQYFLPEEFLFNKRVRRPPDNPINCLISFGNTLLYTKTITQIYHTHLNQSISFLHSPSEGRFSLCLDLCEVFKPIIVFSTIFDLVNNKRIKVEKHFDKKLNYCLLNEEGKKIFVEAFNDRINTTFKHSTLNRNVSYQTALKLEGYKLQKFILEDTPFIPFNMEIKK